MPNQKSCSYNPSFSWPNRLSFGVISRIQICGPSQKIKNFSVSCLRKNTLVQLSNTTLAQFADETRVRVNTDDHNDEFDSLITKISLLKTNKSFTRMCTSTVCRTRSAGCTSAPVLSTICTRKLPSQQFTAT